MKIIFLIKIKSLIGMRSVKYSIVKGIRSIKYSRWLNGRFPGLKNKDLWSGDRASFARAGFVGAFCAFIPVPLQMPLAAIISYYVRANIPFAVALAWLTNPVTMWPIWTFGYLVGAWVLGRPTLGRIEVTEGVNMWGWMTEVLPQIWLPLWLGNSLLGLMVGSWLYLVIRFVPLPQFNILRKKKKSPSSQATQLSPSQVDASR
jgi:uncharacterized protein